ncbi:MAG: phage Gp37/Gp68 family protein [Azoarcus sp.]|jgi:protein gp37|nr:phage Gp37/Gp68 family protein [Azoarcus sp.]
MGENTKIKWATHTFNPWVGCTKVSPACDYCYAEGWAKRSGMVTWGAGAERRRTSAANWRMPEKWNRQAEIQFSAWERFQEYNGLSNDEMIEKHGFIKPQRPRVFCSSLADVFDNAVPQEWRIDLFNLILSTPYIDWLLLTKRIGNARKMIEDTLPANMKALPPERPPAWPNVWLGATISNQEEADRDIPKLLQIPANMRWLSIEPLLEPVDIHHRLGACVFTEADPWETGRGIDWVVVGGETGPRARPMHPDWVRSIRDQCIRKGVPFFFKQWGEWLSGGLWPEVILDYPNAKTNNLEGHKFFRIGKRASGRLLDGRTWDEYPRS